LARQEDRVQASFYMSGNFEMGISRENVWMDAGALVAQLTGA
jgi:hypothetical protein